jgi:hypothetical protein
MTARLSIVRAFPNSNWGDLHFPNNEPVDWHLDVVYLRYMWEYGEDTILETAFYELFAESITFPDLPKWLQE